MRAKGLERYQLVLNWELLLKLWAGDIAIKKDVIKTKSSAL
jgi:hypothetical protein